MRQALLDAGGGGGKGGGGGRLAGGCWGTSRTDLLPVHLSFKMT